MTTWRLILYLLPSLIPLLISIPSLDFVSDYFKKFVPNSDLNFTSRLRIRVWDIEVKSLVRNFSTVLWEWNSKNKMVNCRHFVEESITSRYYEREDTAELEKRQQAILIDDTVTFFHHVNRPNIQYKMWAERNTDQDGVQQTELILTIRIKNGTPQQLIDHIQYIFSESKRIRDTVNKPQQIFVSTPNTDSESSNERLKFMIYKFQTTSSFRNFFCEEATTVLSDLDYYLNNKAVYERTGRPWTYTILNEGPPGVGKTKLVKAIAEYTGYTLFVINLSHIQNIQMLYETFHMPSIGGEYVPHDKRIYYIPEVDTQAMTMLNKRDKEKEKQFTNLVESLSEINDSKEKDKEKEKDKDKTVEKGKHYTYKPDNLLTLGEILNVMDGVPERYGHIMIFDTNCLKTLDPAFLRPGRIDRLISWKHMSAKSVAEFLTNFYSESIPAGITLPDRCYTAADLNSIVGKHATLQSCLDFIRINREKIESEPLQFRDCVDMSFQ